MDPVVEEYAAGLMDKLGTHIVVMAIHARERRDDESVGPTLVQCFSGFLLTHRGVCVFVTAGHGLQKLDRQLEEGSIEIVAARIIDSFRRDAKHDIPVPFEYATADRAYANDDEAGVDFGLVRIRPYFLKTIEAQGVRPIGVGGWANFESDEFDHFYLVGVPRERVVVEGEESSHVTLSLTLLGLTQVEVPPECAKQNERFAARINDLGSLEDIDGMSGGPIYGVIPGTPPQYRLAAVQSAWLDSRQIILACRIDVLLAVVEQYLVEPEVDAQGI